MKPSAIQKRFFSFQGRLNRWAYFKNLFIIAVIGLLLSIGSFATSLNKNIQDVSPVGVVVFFLVGLVTKVADITLTARRLHDLNRSGWWQLLGPVMILFVVMIDYIVIHLFPQSLPEIKFNIMFTTRIVGFIIGLIYEIYVFFWKGTTGPNDYGPDPLVTLANTSISEEKAKGEAE